MVILFPLSQVEERVIQWVTRVVPPIATAVILLVGVISLA